MRTPYLIQRLKFKNNGRGAFDSVLQCDYMGSAEFEFGALPISLKQLTRNFGSLKVNFFKSVADYRGRALCIISEGEKAKTYFNSYFVKLALDEIRLKERTNLKANITGICWRDKPLESHDIVDAWWDIENHVIFTFGKNNAKKILKAIENTLAKKKLAGESEWY